MKRVLFQVFLVMVSLQASNTSLPAEENKAGPQDYAEKLNQVESSKRDLEKAQRTVTGLNRIKSDLMFLRREFQHVKRPKSVDEILVSSTSSSPEDVNKTIETAKQHFCDGFRKAIKRCHAPYLTLPEHDACINGLLTNLEHIFTQDLAFGTITGLPTATQKLSEDSFAEVSERLSMLIDQELEKVDSRINVALVQEQAVLKNHNDTIGRFWRELTGRDREAESYKTFGILGLSAMAITALGCVIVLLWLAHKAKLADHFTEYLRWNPLLDLTTVFLLTIVIVLLGLNKQLSSEVLGTLIGGISGYVLGRNSRAASAAQERNEMRDFLRQGSATNASPPSDRAFLVMEQDLNRFVLPEDLSNKPDNKLMLSEIREYFEKNKQDRAIIFSPPGAVQGIARGVLHRSLIESFLVRKAPHSAKDEKIKTLSLHDLITDSEFKAAFEYSAAWVSPDTPLSAVRTAMESKSLSMGPKYNCYDALVTQNGLSNEIVVGIVTNEILQRKARM